LVKRYPRLRRLVVDAELISRRAAGETLRILARDYDVSHTTLGRYFKRPQVAIALRRAERLQQADLRAAEADRRAELRAERVAQRRAARQQAAARGRAAGQPPAAPRRPEAASRPEAVRDSGGSARSGSVGPAAAATRSGLPRRASPSSAWLDQHDARVPLSRAELGTPADVKAAAAVAAGGGMQAVIEATGLRSEKNVLARIDPAILERARYNDTTPAAIAAPPAQPDRASR
jgi:hypothetical protein